MLERRVRHYSKARLCRIQFEGWWMWRGQPAPTSRSRYDISPPTCKFPTFILCSPPGGGINRGGDSEVRLTLGPVSNHSHRRVEQPSRWGRQSQ